MSTPSPEPLPNEDAARASQEWFASEIEPHDGQLKAWLRGTYPGVRDVDDVVQESYLRVWRARATQPIVSAKAFLFQVARRIALDVLRKNRNSPLDFEGDLAASRVMDTAPDAVRALITRETLRLLADALASLPDRDREVILRHKLQGLPQRDVARALGVPERTVEKRCLRGLRACECYLRRRGVNGFFTEP